MIFIFVFNKKKICIKTREMKKETKAHIQKNVTNELNMEIKDKKTMVCFLLSEDANPDI